MQSLPVVSHSMWERVLSMPNRSTAESAEAWEPILKALDPVVERTLKSGEFKNLRSTFEKAAPAEISEDGYFCDYVVATPIAGSFKGVLIQMVVSRSSPSRELAVLYWMSGGRLKRSIVSQLLPYFPCLLGSASGYARGDRIWIEGDKTFAPLSWGYRPIWALVLRRNGDRWSTAAQRTLSDPATIDIAVDRSSVMFDVKRFGPTGSPSISPNTPGFVTDEHWAVLNRSIATVKSSPIHNEYWVARQLVDRLRSRDAKGILAFVSSKEVLASCDLRALAESTVKLQVSAYRDKNNEIELWIQSLVIDGKMFGYSLHFDRRSGWPKIDQIVKSPS